MVYLDLITDFFPPKVRFLVRSLIVLGLTFLAHAILVSLHRWIQYLLKPGRKSLVEWRRKAPKVITVIGLSRSALTFALYFLVAGYLLTEVGVPVTAYLASASLIGLAVAFGSQGLVQDIVVGLTLIFTDVIDVGDMVDLAGQTGRVHQVGLRYTVLTNGQEQKVYVNNRNVSQINRYDQNHVKLYVDIEVPDDADVESLRNEILAIGQGMRHQFPSIILSEPELSEERAVGPGEWSYLRLKLPLWPGQADLINGQMKQRILETIRNDYPDYPDWKVVITTRSN